jgi:hypothetical protein
MCREHKQKTVVALTNGDNTSGVICPLATDFDDPLLLIAAGTRITRDRYDRHKTRRPIDQ